MVLGDADPVEPQFLGIPAALDHAAKGARTRLAVIGAGRHRPLPRQVRGRVVAPGFEIRGLHFGASPGSAGAVVGIVLALAGAEPQPLRPRVRAMRGPRTGSSGRCACSMAWASSAAWSFHSSSRTSLSGSAAL